MQRMLGSYEEAFAMLSSRREELRCAMKRSGLSRKEYDELDLRQQLLAMECNELLQQMCCIRQYPEQYHGGGQLVKI